MRKNAVIIILCAVLAASIFYAPVTNLVASNANLNGNTERLRTKPSIVVFLGDSMTAHGNWDGYFPRQIIINHGVSGDKTSDVLWRLTPVIQNNPDQLFLMIGINDLLRGVPEETFITNYKKITERIKAQSPDTTVFIQSILPVNPEKLKVPADFSEKIIRMNTEIKKIAAASGFNYIDLYDVYAQKDKLPRSFTNDGLHLKEKAYTKWKEEIQNYILH